METVFIEATNGPQNWGKFMVARFDREEWARPSSIDGISILAGRGWGPGHMLIVDLQTGEGAIFRPGGSPPADLEKHAVWVCPLFEPFLEWIYKQDLTDLSALPPIIDLPDAPFLWAGHRRLGPDEALIAELKRRGRLVVHDGDGVWALVDVDPETVHATSPHEVAP